MKLYKNELILVKFIKLDIAIVYIFLFDSSRPINNLSVI